MHRFTVRAWACGLVVMAAVSAQAQTPACAAVVLMPPCTAGSQV